MPDRIRKLPKKRAAFAHEYRGKGDGVRAADAAGYIGDRRALSVRAVECLADPRVQQVLRDRGIPYAKDPESELIEVEVPNTADPRAFFTSILENPSAKLEHKIKAAERIEQMDRHDKGTSDIETYRAEIRNQLMEAHRVREARLATIEGVWHELGLLAQKAPEEAAPLLRDCASRVAELGEGRMA